MKPRAVDFVSYSVTDMDVDAALEELRGRGVPIAMEPIETPVCFMAVVSDPGAWDARAGRQGAP